MMRRLPFAAGLAATALVAVPVAAAPRPSAQTRNYVEAAAQSDTFETMEGYTALAESHDPQLLDFARRMIADHGRSSQTLRAAAERAGMAPPPMSVGAGLSPMLAALQSERGQAFDRTYWRQQALAHRAALVTAQDYAAHGDDAAVRQAAAAAVPVISAHLAMADAMLTRTRDDN